MPTDYIKAADLHAALARVRDETKAKVWAEAYAAGQKAEQEQYAKAIQLVTLGRALTGGQQVVTQPLGNTSGTAWEQFLAAPTTVADPVAEAARNVKAFAENPALPRRENPDGPAYGKLLQLPEGWVHPDGAVTPLTHAGEAHVAALAEADPGVSQAFHASLARHAHRTHPGEFVDDDVKDYAFDKGFIHLTGRGRTIEATGKHEMLLKHRKFLKELAMRATTLVFRPVDGDDYEVKAKADRERKAIPADPRHRTADVLGTHAVVRDALSRGDTQYANRQREIHADALVDAGADREAALERVIAGQQPPSHLAATFKNAANLKRAARSRTEAAHGATEEAYQQSLDNGPPIGNTNGIVIDHAGRAFDWSHGAQFSSRLGEQKAAGEHHDRAAWRHDRTAADMIERGFPELAALHRHAAEQHRVAAAYNAAAHHTDTQRTVKAQEDYHPRFRDELHDAGRQHEMEGPPTPGLRSQEAYVVSDRLMDEVLHTHGLHVPYSSLENAHEKALDAADLGDDAGRRYWHRRARDLHILMRGQLGATPGDPTRQAHEKAMSLHGKASADDSASRQVLRDHASLNGEEQSQVAHAIGSHGGDVSAAAHTATAAANKLTDPEKDFGTVSRAWNVPVVAKDHRKASAAHAVVSQNIPRDTPYRAAVAADVPDDVSGFNVTFYKPSATHLGRQVEWFPTNHPTRDTIGGFSMPVRSSHGQNAAITHENVGEWSVYDVDTERRRTDAISAHRVASYLHQEAATGDHTAREVKAIRTNYDKMEQHEGSHEPQVGDYDEDDADTANPVHSQFYRSEKLFHESERAGHLHTLQRQYPDLDPHAVNENMLDAADLGDEAGHRYWKRRLGDVHLMLHQAAASDGDDVLAEYHKAAAIRTTGKSYHTDDDVIAAHLIAHHKGDVGAAAKHASEAAIEATDPELLKRTDHTGVVIEHTFNNATPGIAAEGHEKAARVIGQAPDTYRPLTHTDIENYGAGNHNTGFYTEPDEHGRRTVISPTGPTTWLNEHEFSIPTRRGYDHYQYPITHENYHTLSTVDTDARRHRADVQQMHEVAALLHREAATGDHETREVKAERKAFAPGIEPVPGAAGRTLHPTAGHPAADNNEAALHAAMLVQPHDTTPRMVLADYYDDHDQPHTAALHRFVAEPTRANFDTLAAFHEHPSEVAHTVEHAAATHANATIPRWVVVDRGVDHDAERRHPATGAITPTGLRNELDNVIHRNAYHPSVQRFPADSPSRTERRLTRDSLMWHHQRYGEEQANFAAAHADPNTVADWGPDPISEQGHAFARTLHHAAAEAHRHARDYLTEQDALDKPTTNDGPIPEGVWRHPRLNRERTV